MIDFTPDDETRLLLETVRRFVETELRPLEDEVEASGTLAPEVAVSLLEKSQALGLFAHLCILPVRRQQERVHHDGINRRHDHPFAIVEPLKILRKTGIVGVRLRPPFLWRSRM